MKLAILHVSEDIFFILHQQKKQILCGFWFSTICFSCFFDVFKFTITVKFFYILQYFFSNSDVARYFQIYGSRYVLLFIGDI